MFKSNPSIKTLGNSLKQLVPQISTNKIKVDILRILKIIAISMGKDSETESACKRWKPILRTPDSETLIENEHSFYMKTGKFMISKHAINQNRDDEKCFITVRI